MSLPYMEFYVSEIVTQTLHLNVEETGIFYRLFTLCWAYDDCKIPADPAWICTHIRCDEWDKIKPVLDDCFEKRRGKYFHPQQREVWLKLKRRQRLIEKRKGLTKDLAVEIFEDEGYVCAYCGTTDADAYEIDHRIPIGRGGDNSRDNLCVACKSCNRKKNNKTAEEFMGVQK